MAVDHLCHSLFCCLQLSLFCSTGNKLVCKSLFDIYTALVMQSECCAYRVYLEPLTKLSLSQRKWTATHQLVQTLKRTTLWPETWHNMWLKCCQQKCRQSLDELGMAGGGQEHLLRDDAHTKHSFFGVQVLNSLTYV